MRNVEGQSWKDICEDAVVLSAYPPPDWPPLRVRLLWAYKLIRAVELMEALGFVHADLSDANIMVTGHGVDAGNLSLIDFDAYFNEQYPSGFRGKSGFSAPEIWNCGLVGIGSDRVAMAILVQDFLLAGDGHITRDDAFSTRYPQEKILGLNGRAHSLIRRNYSEIADLLEDTLRIQAPEKRPQPRLWLRALSCFLETSPK